MIINKLSLKNFMPFRDSIIDLSVKDNSNVILIWGENEHGKTSLLNAIRWAFYGTATLRDSKQLGCEQLFNKISLKKDEKEMNVMVNFSHRGEKYELIRKATIKPSISKPEKDSDFTQDWSLRVGKNVLNYDDAVHKINQIIPKEISRFFLFDGELLSDYEELVSEDSLESTKELVERIEDILRLPTLKNGKAHFGVLTDEATKQLSSYASTSKKNRDYVNRIRELEGDNESFLKDIKILKEGDKKKGIEKGLEEIKEEWSELVAWLKRNRDVERELGQIDAIENIIGPKKKDLNAEQEEFTKLTQNLWKATLYLKIEDEKAKVVEELTDLMELQKDCLSLDGEIKILEELVKSRICSVCGSTHPDVKTFDQRLNKKKGKRKELTNLSSNELNKDIAVLNLKNSTLKNLSINSGLETFCSKDTQLTTLRVDIRKLEDDRDTLVEKTQGKEKEFVEKRNDERELKTEKERREQDIKEHGDKIDINKDKIKSLNGMLQLTGDKADAKEKEKDIYSDLKDLFDGASSVLRNKAKEDVEKEASQAFLQLKHEKTKYKGLSINENYGLGIIDEYDEIKSSRSAGAEQIVALSLIHGLTKGANLECPLIMDTPFGRLDTEHTGNTLNFFQDAFQQLIFLVHEKETPKELLSNIKSNIAIEYEVTQESDYHSVIEKKKS